MKFGVVAALVLFGAASFGHDTSVTASMKIDQRLGARAPLDAAFQDETGAKVTLGSMLHGKPVMLVPLYYKCAGACKEVAVGVVSLANDLLQARISKDFEILYLGIDPRETPPLAKERLDEDRSLYKYGGAKAGWHGLVGALDQIRRVTNALGFNYYYNPKTGVIRHPTGFILLTPDGRASKYFFGKDYTPKAVLAAIETAKVKRVGKPELKPILFGCLMPDPKTGKYRIVVKQTLKVAGIATLLVLVSSMAIMSLRNRKGPRESGRGETQ